MECWFFVEAKSVALVILGDNKQLQLSERSRRIYRKVTIGKECTAWLLNAVEELSIINGSSQLSKARRDGDKVVIIQRSENSWGRFLSITEYGRNGQQGLIVVPEGEEGKGWRYCATELRRVVEHFRYPNGKGPVTGEEQGKPNHLKLIERGEKAGLASYAEVAGRGDQTSTVVEGTEARRRKTWEQTRKGEEKRSTLEVITQGTKTSSNAEAGCSGCVHGSTGSWAGLKGQTGPCFRADEGDGVLGVTTKVTLKGFLWGVRKKLEQLTKEVDWALADVGLDLIQAHTWPSRKGRGAVNNGPSKSPSKSPTQKKLRLKRRLKWVPKPTSTASTLRKEPPDEGRRSEKRVDDGQVEGGRAFQPAERCVELGDNTITLGISVGGECQALEILAGAQGSRGKAGSQPDRADEKNGRVPTLLGGSVLSLDPSMGVCVGTLLPAEPLAELQGSGERAKTSTDLIDDSHLSEKDKGDTSSSSSGREALLDQAVGPIVSSWVVQHSEESIPTGPVEAAWALIHRGGQRSPLVDFHTSPTSPARA